MRDTTLATLYYYKYIYYYYYYHYYAELKQSQRVINALKWDCFQNFFFFLKIVRYYFRNCVSSDQQQELIHTIKYRYSLTLLYKLFCNTNENVFKTVVWAKVVKILGFSVSPSASA